MKFLKSFKYPLILVFLPASALAITVKLLGWLQPFELMAYDWFFRMRPLEPEDERIVVVGLQEQEIKRFYPISDSTLATLLQKIKSQKPNLIGLDLFRDISVGTGKEELEKVFRTTPNLYGGKKVIGPDLVSAHPVLEELGQVATGDQLHDIDGVIRRSLLQAENDYENSVYSLGTTLAFLYLQDKEIFPEQTPDGLGIQLGTVRFYRLDEFTSGYHHAQSGGYQILVNFRNPKQDFKKVSFSEVIDGKVAADLFKDKIVIVGTSAVSIKDQFFIPYSRTFNHVPQPIYGVEYVAHEVSNITSAVLDGRPIIRILPYLWLEALVKYGFILAWGLVGCLAIWRFKDSRTSLDLLLFLLIPLIVMAGIIGISFIAFIGGWWLPLIPTLLEVFWIFLFSIFWILKEKISNYRKLLQDLENAQSKIIAGQKQKILAELVSGVAHEVNNPLNFVENYAEFSRDWLEGLNQDINTARLTGQLNQEKLEEFQDRLGRIAENLGEIITYSQKASGIAKLILQQSPNKPVEPILTDINKLIVSVFDVCCYSKSKENNFPINQLTELDPSLGEISVPAEELTQCLINLINNACDAVIEKKKAVQGDFNSTVMVKSMLLEDGQQLEIQVEDNGIGINPEVQAFLFNPFFTTKKDGTGLGLYLSQQAIQNYGGSISWKREGNWTIFRIILPVQ
jgi:CHASE2 domain-containing sensor protein/nitrogen-specific signal transduction histidine kinase